MTGLASGGSAWVGTGWRALGPMVLSLATAIGCSDGGGSATARDGAADSDSRAEEAGVLANGANGPDGGARAGDAGDGAAPTAGDAAVPAGWTCPASAYGDGKCDCGCGGVDVDCPDTHVASCESCTAFGSCANGPCPSSLAPADNTRCELPADWSCAAATYGDGTCNCGCSVVDIDCADASVAS
jgi:hypothetical protein